MNELRGSEVIVKYLERQKVEYVFTLTGHTIVDLYDALYSPDINLIQVRHEAVAAYMADGYFRVTHKPGVVVTHVGPGLLNAVPAVANAALDSSAMIIISGDAPSIYEGAGAHQEINLLIDLSQHLTYLPFVKRVWQVHHVHNLERILDRAFSLALSNRPGPVLVDIPMEIFSLKTNKHGIYRRLHRLNDLRIRPSPEKINEAINMILRSERPVILAGGGVRLSEAEPELLEFAELLNAPVVTTMGGKGTFPEDHPLALGFAGGWGNPAANKALLEADLVIALGTRFGEVNSSSWIYGYTFDFSKSRLLRIDIDEKEQSKSFPEDLFLLGDIKATLREIIDQLRNLIRKGKVERSPWFNSFKEVYDKYWEDFMSVTAENTPIRPDYIVKVLQMLIKKDENISLVTDVGWPKNGIAQFLRITKPHNYITTAGLAIMGFAPPAALGVKLGNPNLKVISVVGDGGFTSTVTCLFTAKQYEIPVVFLVLNNYSFGTIQNIQRIHYGERYIGTAFYDKYKRLYNPDFVKIAEASGVKGMRIERPSELLDALNEAIKLSEPVVVEVPTALQPDVPVTGHWSISEIYHGKLIYMFDRRENIE